MYYHKRIMRERRVEEILLSPTQFKREALFKRISGTDRNTEDGGVRE